MAAFWDERAREDALHFVDTREPYRAADEARFWARGESDLDRLLELLDLRIEPGDHVLDLGCGIGRLTRVLAARAARVTALDVSAEMLERARALQPDLAGVTWVLGDGTSLAGVGDASVDAAISHVVLQHIPSAAVQLGYVAELGRVLRPGGWAAFSLSTDPALHRPRRPSLRALAGRGPRGRRRPEWLGAAVDAGRLRDVAAAAGLALERVEGEGTQFTLVRARRTGS